MTIDYDIELFFSQYCAAFNLLDGERIAQFYALPSGLAQNCQYIHWRDFDAVKSNMLDLCHFYTANAYKKATFIISSMIKQGANHAIAHLYWTIERADLAPWTFHTSYNLIYTEQGWRILLCTAYEEFSLAI
jgi:hypothetical protein